MAKRIGLIGGQSGKMAALAGLLLAAAGPEGVRAMGRAVGKAISKTVRPTGNPTPGETGAIMIRKFFEWLEEWVMDDDNMFIGIGKMLLVIAVFCAIILGPFIYADATAPAFTLQKREWSCIQSHEETHWVYIGKIYMPQTEAVCDEYRRIRSGE